MSAITAKASRKMKKYAVLTREPRCFLGSFDFSWEQRKLGDVVKEITRNDPESEAPIMMITANNGFIEQSERYAFNNAGESLKKYILLKKGELAYNHGASKLRPYGSCFALTTAENARIPFVYHCFSAENQNAEFMSIELNGAEIENQLRKIVSSGARMDGLLNISFDEYTSVSVLLPGTEEQDRIADFFRHLDNLITLHQRKCIFFTGRAGRLISTVNKKRITSSWEQRKFEEIAVRSSVICSDDTLPRVEYEDIVSGTGRLNKDIYAKQSSKSGIVFHQGDVLYGKLRPYLQNWLLPTFDGLAVGDFCVLQPQNADSSFLYRLIQSRQFDEVANQSTGTKMPRADWKLVSKTVFSIPSNISEQAAIGTYFTALDSLITLHQRQPFLQSPPDISLIVQLTPPFYTFSWEQRKLGDIADIVGGGTPSTGNQSYWDGDIDWYAPAEIADQIYANSSQKKITGLGYENSSAKMLPPGTVLFTSRAGIGKTAILTRKGCTNQGFQSIVPHRGELDSYFIFSRTEELKRYGELVGAGSTFVEVSGKQMAVMELMMPPTMREQQTIGGFFQQLDQLITLHQRQTIVYAVIRSIRKVILAERQYFAPPMVRKSP